MKIKGATRIELSAQERIEKQQQQQQKYGINEPKKKERRKNIVKQ